MVCAVELEMLEEVDQTSGSHHGVTTWLSRGLKIEESQISLKRDMVQLRSRGTELQQLALAQRAD